MASVLVTLVRAKGSSYRQPGARLLLGSDGTYAGTISGGCLEAEVLRKATWSVRQGAVVQQYSTLFDDTSDMPFGLGCGGVVNLLLEPTHTSEFRELMKAIEQALSGRASVVLTRLPSNTGNLARAVISTEGEFLFASGGLSKTELVQMRNVVLYGQETSQDELFTERLAEPQRLFVLGAGDDARPLVSLANLLGWNVHVMDERSQLARLQRFPEAQSVSVIRSPESDLQQIKQNDAVVLMTHIYEQDRDMLAVVLPLRPRYLGMLGARHRTSLLISEVAAKLECSVAECCEHIQAPIGLNLGGDGPEAIALAVIAEIQASRTGSTATSRKLSSADVEGYLQQRSSMQYLQLHCALNSV